MTASQAMKRLWDLLPHLDTTDGPTTVRWFAKSPDGSVKWGGFVDSFAELWNAAVNCPGMNFYVCPNPSDSRSGVRHSTKDVTHWSWFLLDVDPVVKEGYDPRVLMEAALAQLGEWLNEDFTKHPPVIIDSGRGMQAWFRLVDVVLDDERDDGIVSPWYIPSIGTRKTVTRRTARLAMRFWLERLSETLGEQGGCKIDTTCSDLPRPMRCPGTTNVKTGRIAEFVRDSDHVFAGIITLAEKLVSRTPPSRFKQEPVPSLPAGSEWQDVFCHLTIKAQNYLTSGKLEPGRHETMWHTARSLAEKGLEPAAVRRALEWANLRRGADNALKDSDIDHAVKTAFTRLTRDEESGIL
jgi:hypothetical protein